MSTDFFRKRSKVIVTCPKRISPYLRDEIQAMGFQIDEEWSTGVALQANMEQCIRLNMCIRTGNQVLYLLDSFPCKNADDLYKHTSEIKWEDILDENGYVSITSNVKNDTIDNNLFANVKVKDAIVDRIKQKKDIRPDSGPDRSKAVIHLYWQENEAALYIDTSGETLAKHNYRKHPGKAPMQEGLAAATILSTGWDIRTNFVNPMCGSGTLAIEAALMALNRYPGLFRSNYGFMHIKGYSEEMYSKEKGKLEKLAAHELSGKIIASDNDPRALNAARANAEIADVEDYIHFQLCDYSETLVPEGGGVVMFNPEYGERLGEFEELEIVYKGMGDFLKQKCKGYRGYILTASPNLAKKVGLRATRKLEFYNSKLDCRLLEYDIYDGSKRIRE